MDEAVFSQKVMGLINSVTTPLLSSLILIDSLINEEINNSEEYGKILLIDEQVQSSIEYFFELRTLSLNYIGNKLINNKTKNLNKGQKQAKNLIDLNSTTINDIEKLDICEQNNKNKNHKKCLREVFIGISIVTNIGIIVWQLYKMMPIFSLKL